MPLTTIVKETDGSAEETGVTAINMRQCLICGEPTRYAHYEIDACRACSVFYRRLADRKNPLVEPASTIVTQREMEIFAARSVVTIDSIKCSSKARTNLCRASERNVFADVRRGLVLMNAIRRTSELSTRPNIPDAYGIFVDGMVIYPTSYGLFNQNTRILISSIYEFARTAFDEFKDLSHEEQWLLVRNFYPFICVLDSEYRMTKLLPDRETMIFASYTTYLDHDTLFRFLSDTPNPKNSGEGMKFLTSHLDGDVRQMRANMKRWNPTEDEYFAFLGICFWSLDKISVGERVHQIAGNYRQLISNNINNINSSFFLMRSKLGMLKLLDVIGDEMLLAQLNL